MIPFIKHLKSPNGKYRTTASAPTPASRAQLSPEFSLPEKKKITNLEELATVANWKTLQMMCMLCLIR